MLEMTGVVGAGYLLGELSGAFLPGFLGLAGGAMLYVISGEMIPETHSHGYENRPLMLLWPSAGHAAYTGDGLIRFYNRMRWL